MLPEEKTFPDLIPHFPTRWQAVVFRNYGIVPVARIAAVLRTGAAEIRRAAAALGLGSIKAGADWRQDAYLTVLRSNWHLLNYPQLMQLMDIDGKRLSAYLYEDDFCSVKLGDKPVLDDVFYAPLSAAERERTERIARIVGPHAAVYKDPPFAFRKRFETCPYDAPAPAVEVRGDCAEAANYLQFWRRYYDLGFLKGAGVVCRIAKKEGWKSEEFSVLREGSSFTIEASEGIGMLRGLQYLAENPDGRFDGRRHTFAMDDRIIYSYFATCGDTLLAGGDCCYPDGLLAELAKRKMNGIWLHGILRQLAPFPFDGEYSRDFELRCQHLNDLIARAKRFGIKVWLYLNEPRSMPLSFFEANPSLLGGTEGSFGALCTSKREVRDWLYEATASLLRSCPGLGGIISITMSENLTNCFSRVHTAPFNCPNCRGRTPQEAAAEVNRIFQSALTASGTGGKLIAWTWGWGEYLHWDRAAIDEGVALLDPATIVMCTSEDSLRVVKGNTVTEVIDYTMSNIGPSEKTAATFAGLRQKNRVGYAKVQVNNTWECAAVPYIPVFSSVETHIRNLQALGVRGLLVSWTLGGYPTFNLDLLGKCVSDGEFCLKKWFEDTFGGDAEAVRGASQQFSRAFAEFPFSLGLLYQGPQNAGCQNLMYAQATGLSSTMVCYPFDDLKAWCGPFKKSALISQFERLMSMWRQGVAVLRTVKGGAAREVSRISEAVYLHFYSSYLQMRFIVLRGLKKYSAKQLSELRGILCAEEDNAARMLALQSADSTIGYEASNQYFYYQNTLLEKLVNVDYLKSVYFGEEPDDI